MATRLNVTAWPGVEAEGEDVVRTVVFSSILGLVILTTVVGNVFVVTAIAIERTLRGVHNYLIVSLAVADLLVACLVMPLSAVNEVRQGWTLGPAACDLWTLCDVLGCTASILHLLAIALDRYWAVTNLDYARQRDPKRIYLLLGAVWAIALAVSLAPALGWKDPDFIKRIQEEKRCLLSQDLAYQVFATCASFYVPLILILILYWRIFKVARSRIRSKVPSKGARAVVVVTDADSTSNGQLVVLASKAREPAEARRERRAAKTLAVITGVFVFCWLPFFVMALLMPVCGDSCAPHDHVFSVLLWLGYANSMVNPIIYTIFSPDFRRAFHRILCGKYPNSATQRL